MFSLKGRCNIGNKQIIRLTHYYLKYILGVKLVHVSIILQTTQYSSIAHQALYKPRVFIPVA